MHRYFALLAYKGTAYHGWQIQPNARTVQEELNKSLSILLRESIETTGCGRTDTGVHATRFYAHFDAGTFITDREQLLFQVNAILPDDIRVYDIFSVKNDQHARFDAIMRSYSYYILRESNPFFKEFTWYNTRELDINLMNEAAARCLLHQDYACFSKTGGQNTTTICQINRCEWLFYDQFLRLDVSANRFLRGMVRAMTGTFIDIGLGKMSLVQFDDLLHSGDRNLAGQSAPAQGLFLEEIVYPYLSTNREYFFKS
jgi:tRNA pseudouridine38-40 synthase